MAEIQTTFVDITSVVPASWFNRLQKHLAGFLNLKVTINGDAVEVVGASSNGVASAYIGGQMRRNDTTASHTFVGEGADTYNVYVVATAAVDTFAVEVSTTTPATSPYRKVAEVDWDGADITELRGVRARIAEHVHDEYAQPRISHNNLINAATGDPHTAYMLPNATRDYTARVRGVTPIAATDLATKEYVESVLGTVKPGMVFYWPSDDAAPAGFLICDGAEVSRTTYSKLFAQIGTAYGVGDGSSTFNLPDVRGRMIRGKRDENLGDTGGTLEHTHTQSTHAHAQEDHWHDFTSHLHTTDGTLSAGAHTHTQGVTGSSGGTHTHSTSIHSHEATGLTIAATAGQSGTGRNVTASREGLFSEDDLDTIESAATHIHGDGSYVTCSPSHLISGFSAASITSATDHAHLPAGNAYAHTHTSGSVTGTSTTGGGGATGAGSAHTHTNPTTASAGDHAHTSGDTGGDVGQTDLSGAETQTGAGGDDVMGSATFPYLTVRAIIRYE